MVFTEEQCKEHLQAWLAADLAVSKSQSYTIGNRVLTRTNSQEIARNIKIWSERLAKVQRGYSGPRTFQIIPG